MGIVRIPPVLRDAVGGSREVTADGTTVAQVLERLFADHPALGDRLTNDGGLSSFVNVYVGGQDVRHLNGLDTPVGADDVVILLPAMAGGATRLEDPRTMSTEPRRIARLDALVRQFWLNDHPFYVEWRAGRLPLPRLADYAAEWAPFIASLEDGWARIGEPDYAAEELEHDQLWSHFLAALGASRPREPRRPQNRTLLAAATGAFASVPEALGALYSFEVQQPATAQSKLSGLREHYSRIVDDEAQEYFRVHATETDEPAMLAARIEALSDDEFARAHTACAIIGAAAWGALDGVFYGEPPTPSPRSSRPADWAPEQEPRSD